MLSQIKTVTFQGLNVIDIDVQTQISNGLPQFSIVGLANKGIKESRERVRSCLSEIGLSLPAKRVTINLSPADTLKEGSHFDLPIALGILVAMKILPQEYFDSHIILGELALNGQLTPISGILPAAIHAHGQNKGLICPHDCATEASWSDCQNILAPKSILQLIEHVKEKITLPQPQAPQIVQERSHLDMNEVKGQKTAKRALEIAAAGGHNLMMIGPPGSGKSMMAQRLNGLLPPMNAQEALETTMIYSISGMLKEKTLIKQRPFRDPHQSASVPSMVGGGTRTKPGELSLAHNGVLFLDEMPEFPRSVLESLRQPLENATVSIARANHHINYPARIQLIGAMNPCRCGHFYNKELTCSKAPQCAQDYQEKISGPILDRFDLFVEFQAFNPLGFSKKTKEESSKDIADRVLRARQVQQSRYQDTPIRLNSHANGSQLNQKASLCDEAENLLERTAEKIHLSARSYIRVIRVARTIADLEESEKIEKIHLSEALSFRKKNIQKYQLPFMKEKHISS